MHTDIRQGRKTRWERQNTWVGTEKIIGQGWETGLLWIREEDWGGARHKTEVQLNTKGGKS